MQSILSEINIITNRMNTINTINTINMINMTNELYKNINEKCCVELYQFELKGYPQTTGINPVQFKNLRNVIKGDCGIINARNGKFNKKMASCDVIFQSGGLFEIGDWYDIYKKWKAKEKITDAVSGCYNNLEYTNEITDIILRAVKINLLFHLKYSEKEIFREPLSELIKKSKILQSYATIWTLDIEDKFQKVIIFGDHHGSFHTFFRNMIRLHRMNIVNMNNYKINDQYILVFLGDIFDRGMYSLEILIIICKLIINNNSKDKTPKIILNRGNHENVELYMIKNNETFWFEVSMKIEDSTVVKYLFALIDLLIGLCPSAVVVKRGNKKWWLSHGGFPLIPDNVDKNGIVRKVKDIKFVKDGVFNLYVDNKMNIAGLDISIPAQIKWNDFNYIFDETVLAKINRGRNIGFQITQTMIGNFFRENNISFVIRGHQDNYGNSLLLSSNGMLDIDDLTEKNYKNIIYMNTDKFINDEVRNAVYGPISRVVIDDNIMDGVSIGDNGIKIYPILTLSTNTDLGRSLVHDSFGIMRFDLDNDSIGDFSKENNLIDVRNEMIDI